jgi:signal transduction histidine kinase
VVSPDGEKRITVLAVAAPLPSDEPGVVDAVVTGFQDVSGLRELADAKDRFLRVASHELRSPITSLRATTALLEMDPTAITDPERRNVMLQRIKRQVDRLIKLVEQLIDSARLNATEVPIQATDCDLAAIAREAIELACSATPSRVVILDAAGPLIGRWDPLRLEQVLSNLVGNALRYSPEDSEVHVQLTGDAKTAIIRVIDRGIGIPTDQLDKVFTPFFRGSNAALQHRGGLGLGLHITAEIVRRHGGTVAVDSTVGKGTVFTVELPRTRLQ